MSQNANPLLRVKNLRVIFDSATGPVEVVRGIDFDVGRERLGIVGESGSGKTQTGRAILGLIPPSGRVEAEQLAFDGIDLLSLNEKGKRALRGQRITMIMQDPRYSLNPVMTIGQQLTEACRAHGRVNRTEARRRVLEILTAVRIQDPERVLGLFPHEVSGGMGQRIMIAMMLMGNPDLLIADEPTSALDVTVQLNILAILDDLVTTRGMGLILISHDLTLIASFCDRVLVMQDGRIVEAIPAANLAAARHPYTRRLLRCQPTLSAGVVQVAEAQAKT